MSSRNIIIERHYIPESLYMEMYGPSNFMNSQNNIVDRIITNSLEQLLDSYRTRRNINNTSNNYTNNNINNDNNNNINNNNINNTTTTRNNSRYRYYHNPFLNTPYTTIPVSNTTYSYSSPLNEMFRDLGVNTGNNTTTTHNNIHNSNNTNTTMSNNIHNSNINNQNEQTNTNPNDETPISANQNINNPNTYTQNTNNQNTRTNTRNAFRRTPQGYVSVQISSTDDMNLGSSANPSDILNNLFRNYFNISQNTNNVDEQVNDDFGLTQREISNYTDIIEYNDLEDNDILCSICQEDIEEEQRCRRINSCQHTFHQSCIDTWFSSHNTCPMCRTRVINQ